MKLKGKIVSIILLGLIGLAVWFYPLIHSLIKPKLIQSTVSTSQAEEPKVLLHFSYASLGIEAPLIDSPNTDPMRLSDWNKMRQAMRQGVNLTYSEASFDASHLAYIVGHSSDTYPHQFSSVFAGLALAKTGEAFQFELDGQTYKYKVIDKKVITPTDGQAFRNLAADDPSVQRVALVTCWPVLTTKNRLVVLGERVL